MDADEMIANLGKRKKVMVAGFWRRFFAFAADILILNVIVFSAFSNIISKYIDFNNLPSLRNGIPTSLAMILILLGVFAFVYFTLLEYGAGKTLGMMIVGIKAEGNLTFWKCTLRNLFIIPVFPMTLLWIIDPIYLIFKKQRLSELITNTNTIFEDEI